MREIVVYWEQREIQFPADTNFVSYSRKWGERKVRFNKSEYSIFLYADSMGCMSCKLQLDKWAEFIREVDSVTQGKVPFIFVLQSSRKREVAHSLK